MAIIRIKPKVKKWISKLPPKHKRQVKNYLLELEQSPLRDDTERLRGHYPFRRGDAGEYRVIYRYEEKKDVVTIILIGKRNGDEVYERLKQLKKMK